MGKLLAGVDKKVDETSAELTKKEIASQIKELSTAHPDFWDWREEMAALVKSNPYLTPAQVFKLARIDNPEKVDELAKKYTKKDEKKGSDEEDVFGGLMPTSGRSAKAGSKKLNAKEAASAAWDEIMGPFNIH